VDSPKTEAGDRTVLIPQPLVDALVAPACPAPTRAGARGLAVPGKAGLPLSYRAYHEHFKALW
jgi:hypothetical protein